jgi:putative transposase
MHIKFTGQEYTIEQRLPNNDLQLKHVASETLLAKPESEVIQALFTEDAELLGDSSEVSYLRMRQTQSLVNDFSALDDNDLRKIEAKRRIKYIEEIRRQGVTEFGKNPEKVQLIIDKVSEAFGDSTPPSCVTLWRWNKDYTASGDDVRVLVPAYKGRGKTSENDRRKISDDLEVCLAVEKIIDDVICEEYLALTRPTVQATYESIVARIAQENNFRNDDDKLPTPHRNTIYRTVNKLDPYEKDKARFGKRIADLRHKVNQQGVRPSRPLERVEIDDTKLDLFVIDEKTNLPIGRPWLMLAICVFTKMILGYYLSFIRPSYLSVMQCLLHSIRPKTYVREQYPEIVHSWDAYGLPELLVVDNAKQYYSAGFDEACLQLGILTQYCPVRHPYYKPSVERVIGSANTRLLHQMPGTTFSSISDKWDYDPKKNAVISMGGLERLLHNWLIDVYQRSYHRGIDDVPARRWEIGTRNFRLHSPTVLKSLTFFWAMLNTA